MATSRREADLEGTIEAMKRVVDKLKAENERYRKAASGGDANKAADAEKKLKSQQQRADKLEEDLNGLRAKLKGHEESSQKLVQRQQQLTSMRKQLKAKEDELENYKQTAGGASEEADALRRKVKTYEERIASLEGSLTSAQTRGNTASAGLERSSLSYDSVLRAKRRTSNHTRHSLPGRIVLQMPQLPHLDKRSPHPRV